MMLCSNCQITYYNVQLMNKTNLLENMI